METNLLFMFLTLTADYLVGTHQIEKECESM